MNTEVRPKGDNQYRYSSKAQPQGMYSYLFIFLSFALQESKAALHMVCTCIAPASEVRRILRIIEDGFGCAGRGDCAVSFPAFICCGLLCHTLILNLCQLFIQ